MTKPVVSVVMGVYNGGDRLAPTVESVLAQEDVDLELVVVDDGSTDDSGAILEGYSRRDVRVRLVRQENRGLTRALMRGCAEARGDFIARQDCADRYLPGRLARTIDVLHANPGVDLVSCGVRVLGPAGEYLYDVVLGPGDATAPLLALELAAIRGPIHASVTFRRSAYERAGGYREEFYFAQDLDLWTRMAERGRHEALGEILLEFSLDESSLSGANRPRQIELATLILECARARRTGGDEHPILERARAIRPIPRSRSAFERAAFNYFVGVCLQKRGAPDARRYFLRALRNNPLHIKSAARLMLGALG